MSGYTKFNIEHVMIKFKGASEEMAEAIALQLEARTKAKIQSNGQIDVGFMLNSVYSISKRNSTYNATMGDGLYANKLGEQVKRKKAPQVSLPSDALAGTAVGANYAIYQEEKKSFLYAAAVETAQDSGVKAKAEKVFRENLHG